MSDSKEIAKQLNVDKETVQRWDNLHKKRDVQRIYVRIGKLLRKY